MMATVLPCQLNHNIMFFPVHTVLKKFALATETSNTIINFQSKNQGWFATRLNQHALLAQLRITPHLVSFGYSSPGIQVIQQASVIAHKGKTRQRAKFGPYVCLLL